MKGTNMGLDAYMSKKLVTVYLDDDLKKVKEKFDEHNLHHLLVVDEEGVLFGVINDRDLFKHLSPTAGTLKETHKDVTLLNKKSHQIMNRALVTTTVKSSITEAVLTFYDQQVSCLPIIDDLNKPIGIITWRDIIKILALQYRHKLSQEAEKTS